MEPLAPAARRHGEGVDGEGCGDCVVGRHVRERVRGHGAHGGSIHRHSRHVIAARRCDCESLVCARADGHGPARRDRPIGTCGRGDGPTGRIGDYYLIGVVAPAPILIVSDRGDVVGRTPGGEVNRIRGHVSCIDLSGIGREYRVKSGDRAVGYDITRYHIGRGVWVPGQTDRPCQSPRFQSK